MSNINPSAYYMKQHVFAHRLVRTKLLCRALVREHSLAPSNEPQTHRSHTCKLHRLDYFCLGQESIIFNHIFLLSIYLSFLCFVFYFTGKHGYLVLYNCSSCCTLHPYPIQYTILIFSEKCYT